MSQQKIKIELLAPAKDYETGVAAINHGADAVYIGALQFGARQAAGNSIADITRLVEYAHLFGVKVYVTLNTILEDADIPAVEQLVAELHAIGVDALIVQDMALLQMNLPPIPLHASTQMDNRDVAKVRFLAKAGIPRVVLARELSLEQIKNIHQEVPETELEVFVHGALCVSYSGQCYASQYCFGRSANKGECAQFCRLPFSLTDANGQIIIKNKHLLSLKDMNRSDHLEQLLDSGVTSLKIEGRLKDISYVKNITSYYRALLDRVMERRSEYTRASYGETTPQFTPSPEKSFNRGFTDYMLCGDKTAMTSFDTPKSKGEYMGRVRFAARSFFTMTGQKEFSNGDGACFIGTDGVLHGFRINKVEGGRIFPASMPPLFPEAEIYRNYDIEFERQMSRPDIPRCIRIKILFSECEQGFKLSATTENGVEANVVADFAKDLAKKPQRENIITQLSKWGNTPFKSMAVDVNMSAEWFLPSSLLADMRRRLCSALLENIKLSYKRDAVVINKTNHDYVSHALDYKGNVSNMLSYAFYKQHGVQSLEPAYEHDTRSGVPVMFCKHCIKYSMGWCSKNGEKIPYAEPLFLLSADGRRFRLSFDCKKCEMSVIAE